MTAEAGGAVFIPKPDCTRLDGACFREGECLADCDRVAESLVRGSEVRQLRDALATERAAREAMQAEVEHLERVVENWRAIKTDALARADAAEAREAALRSRCEGLEARLNDDGDEGFAKQELRELLSAGGAGNG